MRPRTSLTVPWRSARFPAATPLIALADGSTTTRRARKHTHAAAALAKVGFFIVAALWVLLLLEPQTWIAAYGFETLHKLPIFLFALLTLQLLLSPPRHGFYAPMLALVIFTAGTTPFAYNIGYAIEPLKKLVVIYLLAVATLRFVTTARQATFIVVLGMLGQYLWFGLQGVRTGAVWWHSMLANEDAFGPLMVVGIATCLYVGLATHGRLRALGMIGSAICVLGLVSSFARGAALAAALVGVIVWVRSPRKGVMTALMAGMLAVLLIATLVIFRDTSREDSKTGFWNEMMTIGEDVDGAGTGGDRYALWDAAVHVFYAHPFVGVGAENFGPAATELLKVGEVKGMYADNPGMLYERKLHNAFYQTLCEYGIFGLAIWLWLIGYFLWTNARLRSPPYGAAWQAMGGTLDLRHLALGLEAGFVGFCGCAYFYNLLFEPWLFTLLTLNTLLYRLVRDTVMVPRPTTRASFRWRSPRAMRAATN